MRYTARPLMNALFVHVPQRDFILTPPIESSIVKRSVVRNGRKTSVSLETEFWEPLKQIAGREGVSISRLVERVAIAADAEQNLFRASRIRVAIRSAAR